MKKIFVAGSLNMDLVFSVDRMPRQGETLKSTQFILNPGGKGANQAVACSKFGSEVYLIGCVGDDLFGTNIIFDLKKTSVNTKYVNKIIEKNTGVAAILIDNGDNRIIIDSGANGSTSYHQIAKAIDKMAAPNDIFLTQFEIPIDAVIYSLKKAKEKHMITILNPAPAYPLHNDIFKFVDVIIPNVIEAEMITGFNHTETDFEQKVIDFFTKRGVKDVVITKGSRGSIYGNSNLLKTFSAFNVESVDTTGAGDTFVGLIATELAKGKSVIDSIERASAAAAITVSRFGAQQAIPDSREIDNFLDVNHKEAQ